MAYRPLFVEKENVKVSFELTEEELKEAVYTYVSETYDTNLRNIRCYFVDSEQTEPRGEILFSRFKAVLEELM